MPWGSWALFSKHTFPKIQTPKLMKCLPGSKHLELPWKFSCGISFDNSNCLALSFGQQHKYLIRERNQEVMRGFREDLGHQHLMPGTGGLWQWWMGPALKAHLREGWSQVSHQARDKLEFSFVLSQKNPLKRLLFIWNWRQLSFKSGRRL